jgi:uncharacterized protein (UPF0262 family)
MYSSASAHRLSASRSPPEAGNCDARAAAAPFRGIVKDYFMVCESYYEAIRRSSLVQIEAIDAGRRSLHDEGSTLLMERLADRVAIDHDTARRLFTLICVLHLRG